jgi:hypothetical protein
MEFWNWLKKSLRPSRRAGRSTDSQLAWTSASSREDGSDVFNDSYFCGSGSNESACSSDGGDSGGDGGGGGD